MRITRLSIALCAAVSMMSAPLSGQSASRSAPMTPPIAKSAAFPPEHQEVRGCRLHCDAQATSGKGVSSVAQNGARQTACARKMLKR